MTTLENRRFALLAALGVVVFLLWQAWQTDYVRKAPEQAEAPATSQPAGEVPTATAPPPGANAPATAQAAAPAREQLAREQPVREQTVRVETDVLVAEIDTRGGDLKRLLLKGYPVAKSKPNEAVALLDDKPERWFVVQSGLAGPQEPVASYKDVFTAAKTEYSLGTADAIDVPLTLRTALGATVTKTYHFRRNNYLVGIDQDLQNAGATPVAASAYVQLWRTPFSIGEEPPFTKPFMGVGLYEQKPGTTDYKFHKLAFKDMEPAEFKQNGGWLAMLQHYFLVALIPPSGETLTFIAKPHATKGYVAQYIGEMHTTAPGASWHYETKLYAGPELHHALETIAPGLELTLDYWILQPVAEPLFWLLDWFYKLTKNWGAAIVLLTIAVRAAMYKLSESQFRSMAKMRKFAPRIQALKERYGEDREGLNRAMMELYKKEKFNPLAGCWPILIQMPVFLSLYWVLSQSVELRQADFVFWLHDLSAADPLYVMPVLYGISMFATQKMSGNVAADPVQQRVMNIMPVMLTAMFAFFPVGLVLYWFVSNCISVLQQWIIQRRLEKEGLGHR